jgi:hypothetical protein
MDLMATTANLIANANRDESEAPRLAASIELAGSAIGEQPAVREASSQDTPLAARNAGDEINRFLLCALIRESARQIKTAAEKSGVCLPFQRIIRRLLDSYGRAAAESPGLLSGPKFNASMLRALNEELCKKECSRYSQETVLSRQMVLAHARWIGDQTRIKDAEEALESALLAQDRLAEPEKLLSEP